ncbi:MAG: DUF1501 domain-containing protein [Pseudomonadota bacterium]
MPISRREFIVATSSALAGVAVASTRAGVSSAPRWIVINLRGGIDGLATVVPYGDPAYRTQRGALAIGEPGDPSGSHDLNGFFGLHPAAASLASLYRSAELAIVPAVSPALVTRSHFDAQKALDLGQGIALNRRVGWLNRALALTPKSRRPDGYAMALGHSMPLVLQGGEPATSWSPRRQPTADADTYERLRALYDDDSFLAAQLERAESAAEMVGGMSRDMRGQRRDGTALFSAAGNLLGRPDGPRVLVLDMHGWDTHANQGGATGRLSRRIGQLASGIATLREGAGSMWASTAGIIVSEFGRTVRANGTRGTDHGTAGMAMLFGGAIRGQQVVGEWPGVHASSLWEGRDLRPTVDVRSLYVSVFAPHFNIAPERMASTVFDDPSIAVIPDLHRRDMA